MKTKQKKRNTNKFKKNLRKQNQGISIQVKRVPVNYPLNNDIIQFEKNVYRVFGKEDFQKDVNDVLFIPSYKTLPEEVVKKIEKHIKTYPVRRGKCHVNSTFLTLNLEGVKTCRGWYSDNIYGVLEMFEKYNEFVMIKSTKEIIESVEEDRKNGNEWKWISIPMMGECWINTNSGTFFLHHSWNELNGVHFDLTREFHKLFLGIPKGIRGWKFYKLKTIESKEDILKNTKLHLSLNKLHELTSFYTGSGNFENTQNSTVCPVLNNCYKSL